MIRSLSYYYLFQAYELLGQHLYGRQWTGQEYAYRNLEGAAPEVMAAKRQPVHDRIAAIDAQIGALDAQIARTVSDEEIRAALLRRDGLMQERLTQFARLHQLPEPSDSNRSTYEALQRHRGTEEHLFEALRKSELTAHINFGAHVPADMWRGTRGFKVYSWLSLAVMPNSYTRLRRASIGFLRNEFDAWLANQMPIVKDETNPISAEAMCRDFLKTEFSQSERKTKAKYFEEAKRRIPELSQRMFHQLWTETAPAAFKKKGRHPDAKK